MSKWHSDIYQDSWYYDSDGNQYWFDPIGESEYDSADSTFGWFADPLGYSLWYYRDS